MRDVLDYLEERRSEFDRHLFVARLLEARIDDAIDGEVAQVEVRHVNTLKSGLLIHLYNIVEAVSTRTMETFGQAVVVDKPKRWTEAILNEWIRAAIWDGEDRLGDGAFKRLAQVGSVLASGGSPDAFTVKGEPGSWTDSTIKKLAKRLGCPLVLSGAISEAAFERAYLNETTAMKFLANRRNAIAHGESTFEDGARGLTLNDIEVMSGRVIPFLKAVTESYEAFLNSKAYLVPEGAVA